MGGWACAASRLGRKHIKGNEIMIDTSTTAGKIKVMQAEENGSIVQFEMNRKWIDVGGNCHWDWSGDTYRIKPQTVKEASSIYIRDIDVVSYHGCFLAGAKWQKEQDND